MVANSGLVDSKHDWSSRIQIFQPGSLLFVVTTGKGGDDVQDHREVELVVAR